MVLRNCGVEKMTAGQSLTAEPTFVGAASPAKPQVQPVSWTEAMRRAIRCPDQLRQHVGLPPVNVAAGESGLAAEAAIGAAEQQFATFAPLEFLARVRRGDPDDPLLKQVLTVPQETLPAAGFVADPVGDQAAQVTPQLLQKYHGRALVVSTGVCGVHCRYCFRRQYDYSLATDEAPTDETAANPASAGNRSLTAEPAEPAEPAGRRPPWSGAIRYLQQQPSIDEVLLSGGDPLTLSDTKLFALLEQLEAIPHLRRLRIHSRMPVVIPQRVTDELVRRLAASRLTCWLVIHCNHAQEIDWAVQSAVAKCVDAGIPVLNQAVLLAGVNDRVEALEMLCRQLVDLRVQPYYLHQLDRVQGAAHFEVPAERGRQLIAALRQRLPGYALPSYVCEIAGALSKLPLDADQPPPAATTSPAEPTQ